MLSKWVESLSQTIPSSTFSLNVQPDQGKKMPKLHVVLQVETPFLDTDRFRESCVTRKCFNQHSFWSSVSDQSCTDLLSVSATINWFSFIHSLHDCDKIAFYFYKFSLRIKSATQVFQGLSLSSPCEVQPSHNLRSQHIESNIQLRTCCVVTAPLKLILLQKLVLKGRLFPLSMNHFLHVWKPSKNVESSRIQMVVKARLIFYWRKWTFLTHPSSHFGIWFLRGWERERENLPTLRILEALSYTLMTLSKREQIRFVLVYHSLPLSLPFKSSTPAWDTQIEKNDERGGLESWNEPTRERGEWKQ